MTWYGRFDDRGQDILSHFRFTHDSRTGLVMLEE